jgi:hypothetical protein
MRLVDVRDRVELAGARTELRAAQSTKRLAARTALNGADRR